MWSKFLREIRGRFELTQQQAIGSLALLFVMLCVVTVPLVYRYIIIEPVQPLEYVDTEEVPVDSVFTSPKHEKVVQSVPKPTKHHIVVPELGKGDSITLPSVEKFSYHKTEKKKLIDLNTADTTAFKTVRGIGSFYAKRIVKYRDRLGGFAFVSQLDNVYNLPVEAKNNLIARLDTSSLRPYHYIDINHVSFKKLLSRKILNYEQVKQVFQYRDKTFFYTTNDLYKTGVDSTAVSLLLSYIEIVQ